MQEAEIDAMLYSVLTDFDNFAEHGFGKEVVGDDKRGRLIIMSVIRIGW